MGLFHMMAEGLEQRRIASNRWTFKNAEKERVHYSAKTSGRNRVAAAASPLASSGLLEHDHEIVWLLPSRLGNERISGDRGRAFGYKSRCRAQLLSVERGITERENAVQLRLCIDPSFFNERASATTVGCLSFNLTVDLHGCDVIVSLAGCLGVGLFNCVRAPWNDDPCACGAVERCKMSKFHPCTNSIIWHLRST